MLTFIYCFRIISGVGGLVEQSTPFFTVKTLITRLLELDSCKNIHEREQLILHHVTDEEMRNFLPLLNDILVLKVDRHDRGCNVPKIVVHNLHLVISSFAVSSNTFYCPYEQC